MEIKNTLNNAIDPYRNNQIENAENSNQRVKNAETAQPETKQGDRISVSPEARLMTVAMTTAKQTAAVRQETVDKIKASVENGTYTVDAKKIAEKLINQEADLFSTLEG